MTREVRKTTSNCGAACTALIALAVVCSFLFLFWVVW